MTYPKDYKADSGVAMVFDTLCDRGHDPRVVAKLLDEYDGESVVDGHLRPRYR